jgi:hypothetical protein
MPRYFLDVHNCSQGRDDIAEEFPNDEALGEKPRASPANSRKSTAGMSRLRFGIKCNRSRSGPAFPDPYQRYRAEIEHASQVCALYDQSPCAACGLRQAPRKTSTNISAQSLTAWAIGGSRRRPLGGRFSLANRAVLMLETAETRQDAGSL